MMRRRHKKSRNGCLECKRRHIKCDETRPRCINCATAERECPYPISDDGAGTSPAEGLSPVASGSGSGPGSVSGPSGIGHGFTPDSVMSILPEVPPFAPAQELAPMVNMVHAELFHHFLTDPDMVYPLSSALAHRLVVQQALREPYLMHQLLALSARHLSIVRPHSGVFYHNQAIQLQTHALTLFNSLDLGYFDLSVGHRLPAFLFSGILGVHALCDMLSHRDDHFPSTLARYVGYLRLHRGVFQTMDGFWEVMKDSELKPVLDTGVKWFETTGQGPECDDIRARIETMGLDEETLKATRKAVDLIQCAFDGHHDPAHTHLLISWGVMIPEPFAQLIEAGRAEAMVILAWYFLALHYSRNAWIIGDAGHYFFAAIVEHLGPAWSEWLATPRQMMNELLEADGMHDPFLSNQQSYTSS